MQTAGANVLIVDDDPLVCSLIEEGLTKNGLECVSVTKPQRAQQMLKDGGFHVLVTDIAMPEINGLELLAHSKSSTPACKVILMTGLDNTRNLAEAISLGAYDYFRKPFEINQLAESISNALSDATDSQELTAKAAKAMRSAAQFKKVSVEAVRALIQAVEAKDPYTRKHSEQVAHYATHVTRYLGQTEEEVEAIHVAALLHDIGKIGIPDSVLTKPGALTDEEFDLVRHHPVLGARILRNISIFTAEANIVRHHHECWDGSGYPDGLVGDDIPWGARILNIADSIDAMLMKRTYKQAYAVEKVLNELRQCSGKQFDPTLAQAAVEWAGENADMLILPAEPSSQPAETQTVA